MRDVAVGRCCESLSKGVAEAWCEHKGSCAGKLEARDFEAKTQPGVYFFVRQPHLQSGGKGQEESNSDAVAQSGDFQNWGAACYKGKKSCVSKGAGDFSCQSGRAIAWMKCAIYAGARNGAGL